MTFSKLGPHCIVPTADARRILEAGAWGGLLLDDFGLATQFPNAKWIGRVYSPFTAESQSGESPPQAASDFVDSQMTKYALNPAIKIWQGHNEPIWANMTEMGWYAQFEIERMKVMQAIGLKCAIGNFSVGNPDQAFWPSFLPALRFARANGHYLALHEYSAPWMWWMTGRYQVNPLEDEGIDGWTTLRYRKIYRQFLQPENIGDLPLVITECGLDRVSPGPAGWETGNWRTCAEQWSTKEGREDGEQYYAEQLIWYDRELQKDAFVVGACIFTFGQNNEAWRDYDIAGTRVVDYLVEHIQSGGNDPPPIPQETPMPIQPSAIVSFNNFYTWDALPGAPELGNTISIPKNFMFDYVHDPARRVTWTDIKPGSPTFGQVRVNDSPFVKPEVHGLVQAQAPDIPFPIGAGELLKNFLAWKPIWTLLSVSFSAVVGSKWKITWPFFPQLLSSDESGVKIYADDPAAGWARLRVREGAASLHIEGSPDSSWYNGRDFAFGHWFSPQVVVDATQSVMTIGLETVSIFGLKDSDFIIATPSFELVQAAPGGNEGSGDPPPIPANTVRGLALAAKSAAQEAIVGVQNVAIATDALVALIG